MRMQEPEQQSQFEQEWQEHSSSGTEYKGKYEPEQQQEYVEVVAGDSYQEEKLHPQEQRNLLGKTLWIVTIILASIGFFLTIVGLVASALVLKYPSGREVTLAGGAMGLASSIVLMLVCIAIFVLAIIALATRTRRAHRWPRRARL